MIRTHNTPTNTFNHTHNTPTIINETIQCITHLRNFKSICDKYQTSIQDENITNQNHIDFQVRTIKNLSQTVHDLKRDICLKQTSLSNLYITHQQNISQSTKDFEQYYLKRILDSDNHTLAIQKQIHVQDIITLNVGGTIYTTRKNTLQSIHNSFLDILVSGRFKPPLDDNKYIFIDRDGPLFKHILNFIRDPSYISTIHNLNTYEKQAVIGEANYYGIDAIIHLCGQTTPYKHDIPTIPSNVKIFWNKDNLWYPGTIFKHTNTPNNDLQISVQYDDGDKRNHLLSTTQWIYN